jgi:hypothetical protein
MLAGAVHNPLSGTSLALRVRILASQACLGKEFTMMPPTKHSFDQAVGQSEGAVIYATGPFFHFQPRFFKHYWRIYTPDLPWEGKEFFDHAPALSTAAYLDLAERYRQEGRSYIVYGFKRPRTGPGVPFDPNSERWKGCVFAPAFDEDPDPIAANGHR